MAERRTVQVECPSCGATWTEVVPDGAVSWPEPEDYCDACLYADEMEGFRP